MRFTVEFPKKELCTPEIGSSSSNTVHYYILSNLTWVIARFGMKVVSHFRLFLYQVSGSIRLIPRDPQIIDLQPLFNYHLISKFLKPVSLPTINSHSEFFRRGNAVSNYYRPRRLPSPPNWVLGA